MPKNWQKTKKQHCEIHPKNVGPTNHEQYPFHKHPFNRQRLKHETYFSTVRELMLQPQGSGLPEELVAATNVSRSVTQ